MHPSVATRPVLVRTFHWEELGIELDDLERGMEDQLSE